MSKRASAVAPTTYPRPAGSPLGWSFYSTALTCWQKWWLKYVEGWEPAVTPSYFTLGSTYHALHEGVPEHAIAAWGAEFVTSLPEAKRLFAARMAGPPLPPAVSKELTVQITSGPLAGIFTTRPDRTELDERGALRLRDYKTAGQLRDSDDMKWAVDGQILGELYATKCGSAIVDIISKAKTPQVRQLEVRATSTKLDEFEALICDLANDISDRTPEWAAGPVSPPRNLTACALILPCLYYDFCWGSGASRALYVKREPRSEWRKALGVASNS
jgi:hypothetical protein